MEGVFSSVNHSSALEKDRCLFLFPYPVTPCWHYVRWPRHSLWWWYICGTNLILFEVNLKVIATPPKSMKTVVKMPITFFSLAISILQASTGFIPVNCHVFPLKSPRNHSLVRALRMPTRFPPFRTIVPWGDVMTVKLTCSYIVLMPF